MITQIQECSPFPIVASIKSEFIEYLLLCEKMDEIPNVGDIERFKQDIDNFCEQNFNVYPEGKTYLAPNGNRYKSYGAEISLTQEECDDYPNIENQAKFFMLQKTLNFFEEIKNEGVETIYWRAKPIFFMKKERPLGNEICIFMRLEMEK